MISSMIFAQEMHQRKHTTPCLPSLSVESLSDDAGSFVGGLLFNALQKKTSETVENHKGLLIGLGIAAAVALGGVIVYKVQTTNKLAQKMEKLSQEN